MSNTATINANAIQTGQHVEGTYFGKAYAGTVTAARVHTIRWDVVMLTVELDEAIRVWDDPREAPRTSLLVHCASDGSETQGFEGSTVTTAG